MILGVRSSPEAWRQSFNSTIEVMRTPWYRLCTFLLPFRHFCVDPLANRWEALIRSRYDAQIYGTKSTEVYTRHNDWVRSVVPKERLLELQPGEGWAPLCGFLGMEVPERDYPHTNETKELRRWFYNVAVTGSCVWVLSVAVCAGLWYVTSRHGGKGNPEL